MEHPGFGVVWDEGDEVGDVPAPLLNDVGGVGGVFAAGEEDRDFHWT